MEKKLIVIVDTDEEYLAPLEYKLLEEWEDKAEIEVITQLKYFNDFFSQPRNIFLLIVNEFLYNEKIQRQNCRHVFVLQEEQETYSGILDKKVRALYKYSSMKEIYAEIMKNVRVNMEVLPVEYTKLYVMYSTCGGSGKTIGGLGLCSALSDLGKRVLYINAEVFQDFNFYLEDKKYASPSFGYALATGEKDLAQRILFETGNEEFDFLRPFEKAPISYQISEQNYLELVRQVREQKKYNVIVLEMSRELTKEKLKLMEYADKIINICMQTEDASFKNERLMSNIHGKEDKWVFVCNRYKKEQENYLGNQISLGMYSITEYIEEQEFSLTLDDIRKKGFFDTTAYLLD
ncbi:MAG: hypothetical protein J5983_01160 [Ruminococcus sp.]|nr:hypothetical protein [Ruminococcus sp.]